MDLLNLAMKEEDFEIRLMNGFEGLKLEIFNSAMRI